MPPDVARARQRAAHPERARPALAGGPARAGPGSSTSLYAPGVYTGYGVKTMPGVREAIEQKRYAEAESEIARVARVLQDEAALVDAAVRGAGEGDAPIAAAGDPRYVFTVFAQPCTIRNASLASTRVSPTG